LYCNYTTFTERGTFHIYRVTPTQMPLNMYTERNESMPCRPNKVTAQLKGTCDYAKHDTYNMWITKHPLAVTYLQDSWAVKYPPRRRELSNSSVSKCSRQLNNNKCTILNNTDNLSTPCTVAEAVDASTKNNRRLKYNHTEKITPYFMC